jgi:hypothetical protein
LGLKLSWVKEKKEKGKVRYDLVKNLVAIC